MSKFKDKIEAQDRTRDLWIAAFVGWLLGLLTAALFHH
jgi:hypothetical protein